MQDFTGIPVSFSLAVKAALASNRPVVALESTVVTHGLPYPQNFSLLKSMESTIVELGAVPATIIVWRGSAHIGISPKLIDDIEAELSSTQAPFLKLGSRELPLALAAGTSGGTTVSATMLLAAKAGIEVFATGGIGGLFEHTTNPLSSRGQGLALAHRAGATLRDIEMVQFHPTALDVGIDPMPLVSEAVRGEGAILVDEHGQRIIDDPLSARDVVSRAEWAALQAGRRVFLDARQHPGPQFPELFGSITEMALEAGIDPVTQLLPVRPAAHYHMGGVRVDLAGRTDVAGLYAAGEVASTGLHGANRLASNSLLEAVVCGRWVAQHWKSLDLELGAPAAPPGLHQVPSEEPAPDRIAEQVRRIVSSAAGVLRDAETLKAALAELAPLRHHDVGLVGYLLVEAALLRRESRGGHARTDFPQRAEIGHHLVIAGDPAASTTTEPIGAVA